MLINGFDPLTCVVDKVVLGGGDWPESEHLTERQVMRKNLPFNGVRKPLKTIEVSGIYSLDGETWYPEFPVSEALREWKNSEFDIIEGIIRFVIQIVPDETLSIREIGFFGGKTMYFYKTNRSIFVIGKTAEATPYRFNYNIKCCFVSTARVNNLVKFLLK